MTRGKKRWNAYMRSLRIKSNRAAGDHRRWWPSEHKCGECGVRHVRLYNAYGSFFRSDDVRCNAHVSEEQRGWYLPMIESSSGDIWGYSSCPDADIDRWSALKDADEQAPKWSQNEWIPGVQQ